jgi:23S rRNA pseudouridine2605 synthase
MSDDEMRRGPKGPRGPRKPGGFGGKAGGGDQRGGGGERPARDGFKSAGFKPGGFKSAGSSRPGAFRDAPPAGERSERPRTERPEGRAGGDRPFKPRFNRDGDAPRSAGTGGERAGGERGNYRAERPSGDGFRPRGPRRDGDSERPPRRFSEGDRPQRDASDAPRSSSRPERRPFLPRGGNPERLASPEKDGGAMRIAKVIARAGAASRREAEEMIEQGRVTVDGALIASPALDVLPSARITVDGEALPARERTRLWLYHKPSGLVSTNHDPEGRTTLFEALPEDLPRVITIGRLDINTEGLLLLTNDGGLARVLGHPETGWLRRYRARAYGEITQDKLDAVRGGVTIDGENFGPVIATRDRQVGDNTWLTVDLREGKNREVKRVLEHLGLTVNRLIRISFGPFQLGELGEGEVEEVRTRVLRDQLGEQLASIAGVDFEASMRHENRIDRPHEDEKPTRASLRGTPRGPGRDGPRDERRGERPRSAERGPRREFGRDGPETEKPARRPREGAYHRAREEAGDAPRDILLRAEEGRGAIWRDEETSGMKPRRAGPRRGADPRDERASREAAGGRERVRAKPIEDPKGRRVTVERVTGASPDLPRKPRYTRADFAPTTAQERPSRRPSSRPREDGERPFKPRGPRSDAGPRNDARPRSDAGPRRDFADRPPRKDFGDRPPRADGERSFRPRKDRGPREDRAPRQDRPPRQDRAPREGGDRPARAFRDRDDAAPRGEGRGGFGGRPPGRTGPGGDRPGRSGPARSPDRGGGDKPRGPRKPKF